MPLLVGMGLSAGIAFLTFFFFLNPFKPGINCPGATSIAGNGCT